MRIKVPLAAALLALSALSIPLLPKELSAQESSSATVTTGSIPEELRGLFDEALSRPDNPLPYSVDEQGAIYVLSQRTASPLRESQLPDLIRRVEGLWLSTRGFPATLAKKRADDVSVHLYEPDGLATSTGHDVYFQLERHREAAQRLSLESLQEKIQESADHRAANLQAPLDSLAAFFDQAQLSAPPAATDARSWAAAPLPLSQTPPFRLQAFRNEAKNPSTRGAIDELMGKTDVPRIPMDVDRALQEARTLGASQDVDWPGVVRKAISALPLGAELIEAGVLNVWEQGYTGQGVRIALFETGFPDTSHPSLKGVANQYVAGQPRDVDGHATITASILRTIAPKAEILAYNVNRPSSLQTLGNELYGTAANALAKRVVEAGERNFAAGLMEDAYRKGARVMSVSMGLTAAEDPANDAIVRKIEDLSKRGVVVVVAAGNNDDNLFNSAAAKVGSSFPAAPSAVSVGYLDALGDANPRSYAGEIYAPGTRIYFPAATSAAFREALAQGRRPPLEQRSVPASATSVAAPFVAALAACMTEAVPQASAARIKDALLSTAVRRELKYSVDYKNPPLDEPVRLEERIEWKTVNPARLLQALLSGAVPVPALAVSPRN